MKYKPHDIIIAKFRHLRDMAPVALKLIKRIEVKPSKGSSMDWPGYVGWDAELINRKEIEYLRKRYSIPFKYPKDITTFIYEDEIIELFKT